MCVLKRRYTKSYTSSLVALGLRENSYSAIVLRDVPGALAATHLLGNLILSVYYSTGSAGVCRHPIHIGLFVCLSPLTAQRGSRDAQGVSAQSVQPWGIAAKDGDIGMAT